MSSLGNSSRLQHLQARSGQNPLELPEVLEHIFKYCPVSDLRQVRLVSKLWLETSLIPWRQGVVVRIWGANSDHYAKPPTRIALTTSLRELLEGDQLSNSSRKRFRNFKIELHSQSDEWWEREDVAQFWRVCGPNMKYLQVSSYNISRHSERIRDVILGSKTLRLETVIINYVRDYSVGWTSWWKDGTAPMSKPSVKCFKVIVSEDVPRVNVPWEELMTCFSNLEELSIEFKSGLPPAANPLVPMAMATLRRMKLFGKVLKLKHLELKEPIGSDANEIQIISLLVHSQLTLETLKLDFGAAMRQRLWLFPLPLYYQLLDSQKDTLRILNVEPLCTPYGYLFLPPESIFHNLDSLTIRVGQWRYGGFLGNTPNLSSLTVLSDDFVDNSYVGSGNPSSLVWMTMDYGDAASSCQKLKKLVFQGNFCLPAFRCLNKWMPNIESLVIPLDTDSFRAVCQFWGRTLRDLTILERPGSFVSDAAIVGRRGQSRLPCIRNLKALWSLKWIRRARPSRQCQLSSASLFGGFFRLPYLHHLEVNAEFTNEEVELLFERVPQAKVFWRNPDYHHGRSARPHQRFVGEYATEPPLDAPKYITRTNFGTNNIA